MREVSLIQVHDSQGRLLLGKRKDNGKYTLAGGHLNPGESAEDGARRELKEETGLTAESLTHHRTIQGNAVTIHCFTALCFGTPSSHLDPDDEVSKWEWIDVEDGIPAKIWDNLHGPEGDENVVRQVFESEDLHKAEAGVWWHGSASGEFVGGRNGLHVGTKAAAKQALTAAIGHPVEGEWDGTGIHKDTLLAGQDTLKARGPYLLCGYNCHAPPHDYYAHQHPEGTPTFADGTPIQDHHKPDIFPVEITGPMTNKPYTPHEDFRANGYMAAAVKKGNPKRGYYYRNVAEDSGSISAVVPPGGAHLRRLDRGLHKAEPHIKDALNSWKGASGDMQLMLQDEKNNEPIPPSGSGKIQRERGKALARELANNHKPSPKLYRGSHISPTGVNSWTESKEIAEGWAKRNGGQVFSVPEGTRGIRIADYGVPDVEREWLIDHGEGNLHKAEVPHPEEQPQKRNAKVPKPPELIVSHNLSAEKLQHASEIGGLIAPSLAIHHKDYTHDGFGNITLVAPPHLADPKTTPVFDADIYSPRHPTVYHSLKPKEAKEFLRWIHPHSKETSRYGASFDSIGDYLDSDKIRHGFRNGLMHSFLSEKAPEVLGTLKESAKVQPPKRFWANSPSIVAFKQKYPDDIDVDTKDHKRDLAEASRKAIPEALAEKYMSEGVSPEARAALDTVHDATIKRAFDTGTGLLSQLAYDQLVEDIYSPKETDWGKIQYGMDGHIRDNGLEPEYEKYAKEKIAPILGDRYFFKNGKKKAYTAENVLKELTSTIRNGEGGISGGIGQIRAAGAKRFRSFDQLRGHQDQLGRHGNNNSPSQVLSGDGRKVEEAKDLNNKNFGDIADALKSASDYGSGAWGALDQTSDVIKHLYKTKGNLHAALREGGFNPDKVSDDTKAKIRQLAADIVMTPTEYFEAKPQRVVDLSEFKAAVVPHNASIDIIKLLNSKGIKHIERYNHEDPVDRKNAVARAAHANDLMLSEDEFWDGVELKKNSRDSEVQNLLLHPDPAERSLALKLDSVTPHDILEAALHQDPNIWQQALSHPDSKHARNVLLASARSHDGADLWDRHLHILSNPDLPAAHVHRLYDTVMDDGTLEPDRRASRLYQISRHPSFGDTELPEDLHKKEIVLPSLHHDVNETTRPELKQFEAAFGSAASDKTPQAKRIVNTGVESGKKVVNITTAEGSHRLLLKPYKTDFNQGWNESTSQSLYHAADIGHLHQKSFVTSYDGEPHTSTVIEPGHTADFLDEMMPGPKTRGDASIRKSYAWDKITPHLADISKIHVMDYLQNNADRHDGNILIRPDGSPVAIDNTGSEALAHLPDHGFKHFSLNQGNSLTDNKLDLHANTIKTWWPQVGSKIRRALTDRLKDLPQDRKNTLLKGYGVRLQHLDSIASGQFDLSKAIKGADHVKSPSESMKDSLGGIMDNTSKAMNPLDLSYFAGQTKSDRATAFEELNSTHQDVHPESHGLGGIEPKTVYRHPTQISRHMVKSAHSPHKLGLFRDIPTGEQVPDFDGDIETTKFEYEANLNSGWNESTSQALYHAGGIGHLCQKSHISHSQGKPALVIHMHQNADTLGELGILKSDTKTPEAKESFRRIAWMDDLISNKDRHTSNIMMTASGQPLAIDHGRAFDDYFRHIYGGRDTNEMILDDSRDRNAARHYGRLDTEQLYPDAFWWDSVKGNVRAKFEGISKATTGARHGAMMKVFDHRAQYLDRKLDPWRNRDIQAESDTRLLDELHKSETPKHPVSIDNCSHPESIQPEVDHYEANVNGKVDSNYENLGGVESKKVYEAPNMHGNGNPQRYIVKHALRRDYSGWNESTSQALYHAADIGHLHQKSHLSEVKKEEDSLDGTYLNQGTLHPTLVIHAADSKHQTLDELEEQIPPAWKSKIDREGLKRIGLMDDLCLNMDRHGSNLMVSPNGQPLAIDHGDSFTPYHLYGKSGDQHRHHEASYSYVFSDAARIAAELEPDIANPPPDVKWWDASKPKLLNKFVECCNLGIGDKTYRDRMIESFTSRLNRIDSQFKR